MPEYINLNPVIREISDVQNNILLLNGKMDTMGAQVGAVTQDLNTTRQKLQELAEAFEKFSRQAERIAVVQRAETQLGNLKSELDRVYGHYALVRRTSVGVLQAFDVGNVTNDVVAQVSEELMIQSPRYWLAPALVGLAAWSRDDKAICEKSVQEAFTRDAAKTSLFFALILRRVNRHDEAYTWLKHYLMNCDATKLTREFAVILEATARGAFGTQAEQLLTNQLGEWDAELRQNAQLRTAQVTAWVEEIASNREQLVVDDYENLRKLSPDFDRMRSLLESATALGVTAKKYEEIRDRLDAPVGKIEDLLDDLLEKLVTEYDAEELPLRRKAAYAEAVIESNGDLAQAQVKTDKYVRALANTVDAVSLQTQAAITPERLGVSISTQRTAIGNGLDNVRAAIDEYTSRYRRDFLPAATIILDGTHSGYASQFGFVEFRCATNEDEQAVRQRLGEYWETLFTPHINQATFQQSDMIMPIMVGVITSVAFLLGMKLLGLLMVVLVVIAVAFYIHRKKTLAERNIAELHVAKEQAIQISNNVITEARAEFTDLMLEFEDRDAEQAELTRVFATWPPSRTTNALHPSATHNEAR